MPGENYWPVDLSDYPEGPDANGKPVDFVINIPAVVDQHRIYIKAVNDSASAQRRLVVNQTGSLNGTDIATGNSVIIAHDDDSVLLFSRTDGTNFTGYDVVASHIFQNTASVAGSSATTIVGLTDTDNAFQAESLWQTNSAGTAATQSNLLDGGTL